MGITLDPDLYEYGNDCVEFPTGLTPKFVYCSVSDVKVGSLWVPGTAMPPNGLWKLEQTGTPCLWEYLHADFDVAFAVLGGATVFNITLNIPPRGAIFLANIAAVVWSGPNVFQNPIPFWFYDGIAQISFIEPGTGPDLTRKADLVNLIGDPETFSNFQPIDNTDFVAGYYKRQDGTNFKMKTSQA